MLKRFFVVLVVLIGFGMSANAQSLYNGWNNVQKSDGTWQVRDQNGTLKFSGRAYKIDNDCNQWYNVQKDDGTWQVRDQYGTLKFSGKAWGVSGCRYNVQKDDGDWQIRDQYGTLKSSGRVSE